MSSDPDFRELWRHSDITDFLHANNRFETNCGGEEDVKLVEWTKSPGAFEMSELGEEPVRESTMLLRTMVSQRAGPGPRYREGDVDNRKGLPRCRRRSQRVVAGEALDDCCWK